MLHLLSTPEGKKAAEPLLNYLMAHRPVSTKSYTRQDLIDLYKSDPDYEFTHEYSVSYEVILLFSLLSGDWNSVHHDAEYATETKFKQQIAHGMISVAQFSGIFGMHIPGNGAVWKQQRVQFEKPVHFDKPHTARVKITHADEKEVIFSTYVTNEANEIVLSGDAILSAKPK